MAESAEELGLEQRCVEPGHWLIEGHHVKASYEGRSRRVASWYFVEPVAGAPPFFLYLRDVREWIKDNL